MNRVSAYIRQSLQDLYPPQELKSLVMMICCDMLGMDALDIYLGKDINLSESKQHELENILLRLRKNEPIQYIRGVASFLGRPFQVAPGVLKPLNWLSLLSVKTRTGSFGYWMLEPEADALLFPFHWRDIKMLLRGISRTMLLL